MTKTILALLAAALIPAAASATYVTYDIVIESYVFAASPLGYGGFGDEAREYNITLDTKNYQPSGNISVYSTPSIQINFDSSYIILQPYNFLYINLEIQPGRLSNRGLSVVSDGDLLGGSASYNPIAGAYYGYVVVPPTVTHIATTLSETAPSSLVSVREFSGSTFLPEPATWGLMVLGFGTVGIALRQRHRVGLARG